MNPLKWFGEKMLKRKIGQARKEGSGVLKFLDGKKSFIFVVLFALAEVARTVTGQDVSVWIDLVIRAMGWQDPLAIEQARNLATQFVPFLLAVWAAVSSARKMRMQYKAGATIGELAQPVGVVKAALADGTLVAKSVNPVGLKVAEVNVVAQGSPASTFASAFALGIEPPTK